MLDIVLALLIVVFAGVGFALGKKLGSTPQNDDRLAERVEFLKESIEHEKSAHQQLKETHQQTYTTLVETQKELEFLNEKFTHRQEELESLQKQFKVEFENLAQKIFEEKSTKISEENQKNIKTLLDPLRERITDFSQKVEESNKQNLTFHETFRVQLRHMQEQSLEMKNETSNLIKALKGDNKLQGNWGELVLERILEKSGLRKDSEYSVQQSFTNEDGRRLMPDVILNLPNNKKIVIDSKVSLVHYEQLVNANEEEKEALSKLHLNSLQRHIKELSEKRYEDIYEIDSPDFVILFIPIEPAFAAALQQEPQLYLKAFERNIILVTPTTLLATLRTIDSMWNNERQHKNALEIAQRAGALHDKFVGFIEDLNKVGLRMNDAKKSYEDAMKKLHTGNGNMVSSILKLQNLGAKAKKELPEANKARALDE
ncbi:MAG: DNA recombination protein RmuC [Bacteroidetes bacterium]|nr:DNA recombination protein RmuC [Bacteroidota bacterium]